MYLYFLIVYKKYGAVVCNFFGFYGFAKSDLVYEMAFNFVASLFESTYMKIYNSDTHFLYVFALRINSHFDI